MIVYNYSSLHVTYRGRLCSEMDGHTQKIMYSQLILNLVVSLIKLNLPLQ